MKRLTERLRDVEVEYGFVVNVSPDLLNEAADEIARLEKIAKAARKVNR
jgi:hypothetical protein